MLFWGGLFLLLCGLLALIRPDVVYLLLESWKSRSDGQAPDAYVLNLRLGGLVFSLVGLAGLLAFFFL